MFKQDNGRPSIRSVRRHLLYMLIAFAGIIIIVVSLITRISIAKTDDALKNKVISMSSSLNVQMKLNMDSYLSRMETIGALAFGEETIYKYDATDPANDEYEAINTEKFISDKLYSLCIMDNFVDYGIVYRNNRTVGKLSNGTMSLFGDTVFDELSSMISRRRTKDGWAAGYNDNFKRIYYVKRIHDNAVLVLSFYTTELQTVFDNPETLRDMDIRLVNADYNILYSSRKNETGTPLPSDILTRISGKTSASVMDDDYLVSVNSCGDDWYVICSIPTEIILKEKNDIKIFLYVVGLIAEVAAIAIGAAVSQSITKPVKRAVALLDTKASTDLLTGILNKQSFNERTETLLAQAPDTERHAFILLDLDNFKGVNYTLGHAYGDKVLTKTGAILKSEFTTEDFLGRIGGDEFCVFVNSDPAEGEDYTGYIRTKCENLCGAFNENYAGKNGDYKISASIGVSFFPQDGKRFEELYSASDKALYHSKKAGKDTYSFCGDLSDGEVNDR